MTVNPQKAGADAQVTEAADASSPRRIWLFTWLGVVLIVTTSFTDPVAAVSLSGCWLVITASAFPRSRWSTAMTVIGTVVFLGLTLRSVPGLG